MPPLGPLGPPKGPLGVPKAPFGPPWGPRWPPLAPRAPNPLQKLPHNFDNLLNIWDDRYLSCNNQTTDTALHRLDAHRAAVKALAWCPWQRNLLASGGGTADRMIRLLGLDPQGVRGPVLGPLGGDLVVAHAGDVAPRGVEGPQSPRAHPDVPDDVDDPEEVPARRNRRGPAPGRPVVEVASR